MQLYALATTVMAPVSVGLFWLWNWALRLGFTALFVSWAYTSLPGALGWLFGRVLRVLLGNEAPGVDVQTLSLRFWMRSGKLHLVLYAEGFGFENPPGFPHQYFAGADSVAIHVAVEMESLWRLRLMFDPSRWPEQSPAILTVPQKFPWDPTAVEKSLTVPAPWHRHYLGVLEIYSIEIQGACCTFELGPNRELSVNGVVRRLAESEVNSTLRRMEDPHGEVGRAMRAAFGMEPLKVPFSPNKLIIWVRKARNLQAPDRDPFGRRTASDPYAEVKVRHQALHTVVQLGTCSPVWEERFVLHVTDPSSLLVVNVYDEDVFNQNVLLGRWVMTMKYLISKPDFCEHGKNFKVKRLQKGTRISGWFPLVDAKYQRLGEMGEVEMVVEWVYDPEFADIYIPPLALNGGAMEQLSMNSEETDYRGGDPTPALIEWKALPILFKLHLFVMHDTSFFLKDIFAGMKGARSKEKRDAIRMTHLWVDGGQVDPPDDFPGLTLWGLMNRVIYLGAVPQALSSEEFRNTALWSVVSGVVTGVGHHRSAARNAAATQRTLAERDVRAESVPHRLHRRMQFLVAAKNLRHKQMDASDADWGMPISHSGALEKTSIPRRHHILRHWKLVHVMAKGRTIYYFPMHHVSENIIGPGRRVDLRKAASIHFDEDLGEICIYMKPPLHNKFLRMWKKKRGAKESEIREWMEVLQNAVEPPRRSPSPTRRRRSSTTIANAIGTPTPEVNALEVGQLIEM